VVGVPEPAARATLDWSQALRLHGSLDGDREIAARMPPSVSLMGDPAGLLEPEAFRRVHLAVVGGCEGEAMLIANWVRKRRTELEEALQLPLASMTWLSTDILPIGFVSCGFLQARPIFSHRWVVIATEDRLRGCEVTGHLIEMLRALGRPYGELAIDRPKDNLSWYAESEPRSPADDVAIHPVTEGLLRFHRGGLFRTALLPYLLSPGTARP
jgi:hypothetical protein